MDSYLQKLRQETEIFMFDTNLQSRMQISQARLNDEAKEDLETEFRRDMYSMIISYDIYVESISLKTVNGDYYVWKMDSSIPHGAFTARLDGHEETASRLRGAMFFTYEELSDGLVTLVRSVRDPIKDVELGTLMLDVNLGFLQEFSSRASDWGSGEDLCCSLSTRRTRWCSIPRLFPRRPCCRWARIQSA